MHKTPHCWKSAGAAYIDTSPPRLAPTKIAGVVSARGITAATAAECPRVRQSPLRPPSPPPHSLPHLSPAPPEPFLTRSTRPFHDQQLAQGPYPARESIKAITSQVMSTERWPLRYGAVRNDRLPRRGARCHFRPEAFWNYRAEDRREGLKEASGLVTEHRVMLCRLLFGLSLRGQIRHRNLISAVRSDTKRSDPI